MGVITVEVLFAGLSGNANNSKVPGPFTLGLWRNHNERCSAVQFGRMTGSPKSVSSTDLPAGQTDMGGRPGP
jgi:hypothetical protein